jgi:SAM-dependent methyltransferase
VIVHTLIRAIIPGSLRRWRRRVRFGGLRRLTPLSRSFGMSRGRPIDRHYIEKFLAANAGDIRGRVLEIGDDSYTRRFGGARVTRSDILHAVAGNPSATIVADLADAPQIESDAFDCIILTQTLMFIYDVPAALATIHRILRPGGVLLASVHGISQIARYDMDRWGEFWRFTTLGAERLLHQRFPRDHVAVQAHGNVLAAASMLYGLACEELRPQELDHHDPDYQLLITIRALKPGAAQVAA